MALNHKLRLFLWRWHKRIGLSCAFVVIVVTLTGVLLNHTSELSLGAKSIQHEALLSHYGMEPAKLRSYQTSYGWISSDEQFNVYLYTQRLTQCSAPLVGGISYGGHLALACENELLLLTSSGEIVERIGTIYGLPDNIQRVGAYADKLFLKVEAKTLNFDLQTLSIGAIMSDEIPLNEINWSAPFVDTKSVDALEPLVIEMSQSRLTWERVLLDLHSGRIAGFVGVILVDLSAVALLFLALSGFWIWYQRKAETNKRKRTNR